MIKRFSATGTFIVVFGAIAGLSTDTLAQQVTFTFRPEAPMSPIPKSDQEYEDFLQVQDQQSPERRLRRASDFLADYFDSEFRHLVLRLRWETLYREGDPQEIIDAAEEALIAEEYFLNGKLGFITDPDSVREVPIARLDLASAKANYYQSMVEAYQSLGDAASVIEHAELGLEANAEALEIYEGMDEETAEGYASVPERVRTVELFLLDTIMRTHEAAGDFARVAESGERLLEVLPDDVPTLQATMAAYMRSGDIENTIAVGRRLLVVEPNDLQALVNVPKLMVEEAPSDQTSRRSYMEEVEPLAEHAVAAAGEFVESPAAEQIADEQKAAIMADVHVTLGAVRFSLEDFAGAAVQYRSAIGFVPNDAVAYYMLGLASNNAQNVDAALSAFARAVYLELPGTQARDNLERVYRIRNGSLEGIDAFVAEEGGRIGTDE